ncbi:MAG: MltA domain-containing protein, partial [Alphaproteobacteria bacterium]|nr:MltA domain-containing protein [Alphaproteobacteria bacterium]
MGPLFVAAFHQFLHKVSWDDVPYAVQNGLTPYQVIAADGSTHGLLTGYFEPWLRGSHTRSKKYAHAVYAPPVDLSVVPNYPQSGQGGQFAFGKMMANGEVAPHVTRGDVMRGALEHQNLELVYVDDAVDLFFAHVQGSAAIEMDDGSIQRIGFQAKSGHPYVAIGKTLKAMGALQSPITMDSIKAWLRANPAQMERVLSSNPSFIFFKMLDKTGPV